MKLSPDEVLINGRTFKKFINRDEIADAVKLIASKINEDYRDKNPVFLIILKGSIFFGADLLRYIELDVTVETLRAKSYGNSLNSSGKVDIVFSGTDLKDKDVIVIEDIVDTGLTLKTLLNKLQELSPASVETAALLSKPDLRKVEVPVKYAGIEIPSHFVVGYGLDFAEQGRQYPDIYAIENH